MPFLLSFHDLNAYAIEVLYLYTYFIILIHEILFYLVINIQLVSTNFENWLSVKNNYFVSQSELSLMRGTNSRFMIWTVVLDKSEMEEGKQEKWKKKNPTSIESISSCYTNYFQMQKN